MKKLISLALIVFALAATVPTAQAFDLKGILKSATDKAGNGNAGSALGGLVDNLLSTDKIEVKQMVGNWKYNAPAVKFRSDNVLQKAGGAAATGVIEDKIKPYFKTAGIENMTMEIKSDNTFTMKVRGINISGTIEPVTDKNSNANFVFNFKAVKKVPLGKLNTYVSKNAKGELDITFDVSKLLDLLQKITAITGNKTLGAASSLLSSYDGVCAGFRLGATK